MLKKIKQLTVTLAAMLLVAVPVLTPAVAHGAIKDELCKGVDTATGGNDACTPTTDADDPINKIIRQVINVFSLIVGAISVIMIIIGGFRYITSGGDGTKVTGAKNTIMYALIGLVIVALAQVIVRFVLGRATS